MAARTVIGATVKAVSRQRKFAARKAALTLVRVQFIEEALYYLNSNFRMIWNEIKRNIGS